VIVFYGKEATMKGTLFDFLKLVEEKPELAKELVELAARYDFEFGDELTDEELETVAGGATCGDTSTSEFQHMDQVINQEMQGVARLMRALGTMRTQVGLAGQKY
jgi:hypothetical protein